jgi:hypothetical protein
MIECAVRRHRGWARARDARDIGLCLELQVGNLSDPEQPLKLYSNAIDVTLLSDGTVNEIGFPAR